MCAGGKKFGNLVWCEIEVLGKKEEEKKEELEGDEKLKIGEIMQNILNESQI